MMKSWLGFGDLNLIFKDFAALNHIEAKKCLCARYPMNRLVDFNQTCIVITLDMLKSWLGFGDLDLIFKVTVGLKCQV